MEIEQVDLTSTKKRTRRRRSIRNLREGVSDVPQSQSAEDFYGSLWLESDEPVRKRKKRRSSLFVGLPGLHSTPLREESFRQDIADLDENDANSVAGYENKDVHDILDIKGSDIVEIEKNVVTDTLANGDLKEAIDLLKVAEYESVDQISSVTSTVIYSQDKEHVNSVSVDVPDRLDSLPGTDNSSPNVSWSKVSPSSMSPDFPVSPSHLANFVDHSGSFAESDTLLTETQGSMLIQNVHNKARKDVMVDTQLVMNSSDKENSFPQALDVTPAEIRQEKDDTGSPSFLSLCKSIAGKVVTFVKTSPSFLATALLDGNKIVSSVSPGVLQDSSMALNSSINLSNSKSANHFSSSSEPGECNGSYIECACKEHLQEKVDKHLDEMEAEIAAERAIVTQKNPNIIVTEKNYANLVKPVIDSSILCSESRTSSVKKSYTKSSSSVRKKRDRQTFLDTFNAVTNELQKEKTSTDSVFSDSSHSTTLRFPKTPNRRKSRCSSQDSSDFFSQLMNESGQTGNSAQDFQVSREQDSTANITPEQSAKSEEERKASEVSRYNSSSTAGSYTSDTYHSQSSEILACIKEIEDTKENAEDCAGEMCDEGKKKNSEEEKGREFEFDNSIDSCLLHMAAEHDALKEGYQFEPDKEGHTVAEAQVCSVNVPEEVTIENEQVMVEKDNKNTDKTLESLDSNPFTAGTVDMGMEDVQKTDCKTDLQHNQDGDLPISQDFVQRRKRKHQLPVSELSDEKQKTVFPEKNASSNSSHKKVKSKSAVSRRKSELSNVATTTEAEREKEQINKCSASKKRKMEKESDTPNDGQSPAASSIEEKISKLTIETLSETTSTGLKNRKMRRRSAKLDLMVDQEKVELDVQGKKIASNKAHNCSEKHLNNQELTSSEKSCADMAEPVNVQLFEEKAKTKSTRRKRRSSNFKDLQMNKREESSDTALEVSRMTDIISQVNLEESSSQGTTTSLEQDQPVTVENLQLPETCTVPRRQRRRSAESAALKIQYMESASCNSPESTSSLNHDTVMVTKGSRKRKLESQMSAEDLELLYKNKNFKKPEERKPWQTIFEIPGMSGDVYSKKRLQRFIEFEKPTQLKLRRRLQRAVKNGWDPRKKKKTELDNDVVESKLAAIREELDDSIDDLADALKDIVETK